MDLEGKVCVITGGASGIGAACGRRFHAAGAKVVLADVNLEGAQSISEEIDGLAVSCDVSEKAQIENLVATVESQIGPIDLFFSNAGIATGGDPLEADIEDWFEQWDVNLMAHVYAIRATLPSMLKRKTGYFVHTSSMAGILTTHGNATYATTKHAVVGLAEWMSITYHNKGIRTSLLCPLAVNTPMLGTRGSVFAQSATGPMKEPEEVADLVHDAILQEQFLILSDPIAQTWMDRKASDLERWLNGMRRLQDKMDEAKRRGRE